MLFVLQIDKKTAIDYNEYNENAHKTAGLQGNGRGRQTGRGSGLQRSKQWLWSFLGVPQKAEERANGFFGTPSLYFQRNSCLEATLCSRKGITQYGSFDNSPAAIPDPEAAHSRWGIPSGSAPEYRHYCQGAGGKQFSAPGGYDPFGKGPAGGKPPKRGDVCD